MNLQNKPILYVCTNKIGQVYRKFCFFYFTLMTVSLTFPPSYTHEKEFKIELRNRRFIAEILFKSFR